jgi:hypothetical protein
MSRILLFSLFLALSSVASATVPVGTIALYSDGRVEKLIAIEDQGLRWEDDRKRQFLRSRNPAVPVLESQQLMPGKSYFQELVNGDPDALKKQPLGTPVHFTMIRHRDGGTKRRYWKCEFLGSKREAVLGQSQTLDRYRCERSALSRKFHYSVRDSREFTYSPELGVLVQMERKTRTRTRSRELVALFRPGEADHKTLSRAVRKVRAE